MDYCDRINACIDASDYLMSVDDGLRMIRGAQNAEDRAVAVQDLLDALTGKPDCCTALKRAREGLRLLQNAIDADASGCDQLRVVLL